jgi:hypothetical protein
MKNSYWASSRIASIIVVGLWILSACGGDDADNPYINSDQANKSTQNPDTNTASDTNPVSDEDSDGAGGSGAPDDASATTGTGQGGSDNVTSFGGSGGPGAAGTGGVTGSVDVGSCQLACDTEGAVCAGTCYTYADLAKSDDCESHCLETTKSCDAQCASAGPGEGGSSEPVSCRLACQTEEPVCRGTCGVYRNLAIRSDCENHCVDNRNTCEANC